MRITTAFNRLLDLTGVWVRTVSFQPDRVVVTVALKRRRLQCPKCSYTTSHRESKQHHDSVWRHLDLGVWRLEIHARLSLKPPIRAACDADLRVGVCARGF